MYAREILHEMSILFCDLGLDIGGCHIAVMAHEASILLKDMP
jgi:hypothetical protein